MNLPVNVGEEEEEELRMMLAQLEYGNKISILRWPKKLTGPRSTGLRLFLSNTWGPINAVALATGAPILLP